MNTPLQITASLGSADHFLRIAAALLDRKKSPRRLTSRDAAELASAVQNAREAIQRSADRLAALHPDINL